MGMFLNSIVPFEEYKNLSGTRFFVDKTELIEELIQAIAVDGQRYFCITRPRRFGKSVMANMVGAFFGKAVEGKDMFASLRIACSDYCQSYLNSQNLWESMWFVILKQLSQKVPYLAQMYCPTYISMFPFI